MSLSVVKIEREEHMLPVLTISHSVNHPVKEEGPVENEPGVQEQLLLNNSPSKPLMPRQEQGYIKCNQYDFF